MRAEAVEVCVRAMILTPLALLIVAAAGWALCAAAGWAPHVDELLMAGAAALFAGELAMMPLLLARRSATPGRAQAALLATLTHMLALLAIGAVVVFGFAAPPAFLYWLLAFYWATLAALVLGCVAFVRSAPGAAT